MTAGSKHDQRAASLAARDAIEPVERLALADAIYANLDQVPAFVEAASVGMYFSGASEVPTTALSLRLAEIEERRIFLPFLLNGVLQLSEWRTQDPVAQAEYGHMHPRYRRAVPLAEVDVLLVPGLAFDARGNRLGSGTGHYDRLLARLDPRTLCIGLAFGIQIVDEVPSEPHDRPVHVVVTEQRVIQTAAGVPGATLPAG